MDMLKYYDKNSIIPVHQKMPAADFINFKFQRERLYSNLGIQMGMLSGKTILEFGPGTGDNARVIADYGPSALDLVDGNPASRECIEDKLNSNVLPGNFCNFYFSDARSFISPRISLNKESVDSG